MQRGARSAVIADRRVDRQRQARCRSRRARTTTPLHDRCRFVCLPIQPKPGVARERLLEHGRAVDEHAKPSAPARCSIARARRAAACAAPCDSRGRARSARRSRAESRRARCGRRASLAANSPCAPRSRARFRDELGRARALAAVAAHVVHVAVAPGGEPFVERRSSAARSTPLTPIFAKPSERPSSFTSAASPASVCSS